MSIFRRAFQRKREEENGRPEDWEADEVYVRNEKGELVKLEVPDAGEAEEEVTPQEAETSSVTLRVPPSPTGKA